MDIIKSDVKNRMKNERKPKYLKYQYNKKHFPPPLLLSPKCFHYFLPFLIISDKEHWVLIVLAQHELAWYGSRMPVTPVL